MSNIFKTGIQIPKVVKKLELSGYHKELKGNINMVWVNLTRAAHQEYADIQEETRTWGLEGKRITDDLQKQVDDSKENKLSKKDIKKLETKNEKVFKDYLETVEPINDSMYAWYSQILSQHENEVHHCTTAEVRAIAEMSRDQDNGNFWGWFSKRIQAMIIAHGNQHLKK